MSSERWLKEEERSGGVDMNCAAAATEISMHLEKCPIGLELVKSRDVITMDQPGILDIVQLERFPSQLPEIL